jgi:hypothetical protein
MPEYYDRVRMHGVQDCGFSKSVDAMRNEA